MFQSSSVIKLNVIARGTKRKLNIINHDSIDFTLANSATFGGVIEVNFEINKAEVDGDEM